VANFDRGAANLRYRISVRHGGSYETRLLSEHEKQVERTKGASTMDEVDKTKAIFFNNIASNLPNGLFGNWLVRATRLYDDPESGLLMRAPFHGEHGDQPVKLSEKDAAAYAKAKAEGSEVPKSMMVEDLNLRGKAARQAMAMMSGLNSIAGSIKDGNPQAMIDRYAAMMKGPTMDLARRALLEAPESGYGVRPLSRMDRLVADPNAAWDAMEKTLIS
jgi:hypothetical protein